MISSTFRSSGLMYLSAISLSGVDRRLDSASLSLAYGFC
jgi:hypothetical protein